ncbi:MAG: class I SAM-dependent methyltransferase [Burkholderiaceae bacterium]
MQRPDTRTKRVGQALALDGSTARIDALYEAWASDYDQDLREERYQAPGYMAVLANELRQRGELEAHGSRLRVLDAGCGTGLVGVELRRAFADAELIGFDLSQAMVDEAARTGCYDRLQGGVDLNQPLAPQILTEHFDLALACGVFTLGHVPPGSIEHLVRVLRPGGVVLVSARHSYCDQTDFDAVCEQLVARGTVSELFSVDGRYIADEDARYRALRRL